jgi:hypothetical protein
VPFLIFQKNHLYARRGAYQSGRLFDYNSEAMALIYLLQLILFLCLMVGINTVRKNSKSAIVAVLSPMGASTAVYFLAYVVYPLYYGLGYLEYEFAPVAASDKVRYEVHLLGILAMYGFLVGSMAVEAVSTSQSFARISRSRSAVSYLFSGVSCLATSFLVFALIPFLIESTDFGSIRANFLLAMEGRGFLTLLLWLGAATTFCGIATANTSFELKISYISLLLFSFLCIIISTRFALTGLMAALVVLWTYDAKREFFRGWPFAVIVCAALATLGAISGAIRGLSDYPFANRLDAFLIFFLFTFDSFQATSVVTAADSTINFSGIYIEDIIFRFLPRAFLEEKPIIYGAVRLQEHFYPGSLPPSGIPIATYPVSLVGESFATYRYFGVFVIPGLVGVVATTLYRAMLNVVKKKSRSSVLDYAPAMVACVWVVNPLEFWRSPSWFFAAVVFSLFFFGLVTALIFATRYLVARSRLSRNANGHCTQI